MTDLATNSHSDSDTVSDSATDNEERERESESDSENEVIEQRKKARARFEIRDMCCVPSCTFSLHGHTHKDYIKHLHRQHRPHQYKDLEALLTPHNIGLCPTGGEARLLTRGGNIYAHTCHHIIHPNNNNIVLSFISRVN